MGQRSGSWWFVGPVYVMVAQLVFQTAYNYMALSVPCYSQENSGEGWQWIATAVGNGLILTLLGRAVSEHEAQMNSVHLLQRDCHLGDSSGYYITENGRIHTTLALNSILQLFFLGLFICLFGYFGKLWRNGESCNYHQTSSTNKEIEKKGASG